MKTTETLQLKSDYINVLLDLAAERTRYRGSCVYELKFDLSLRDIRLLRTVGGSPGMTIGQLVEQCAIEKTLTSKLVSALVQRGLIRRQVGEQDARQTHLYLTDAGLGLVMQAEPLGAKLEAGFLYCLSAEEVDSLRSILRKLIAAEQDTRPAFEARLAQMRQQTP